MQKQFIQIEPLASNVRICGFRNLSKFIEDE